MQPLHRILVLFSAVALLLLHPLNSPAEQIDPLTLKAQQGQVKAQFLLGAAYYSGKGTKRNLQKAFYWYEKAAQQGHPEAQRALGKMYKLGHGTARDPEKAAFWYLKAAEQGQARAQTKLGILYEQGVGVSQNYEEARSWYEKAAAQGSALGQTYLGRMYELAIGIEADFSQAFYWYEKAAVQGYDRAQTNLGALYEAGQGVEKNYDKAIAWYTKAAEQNYPRAQFYLGRMYEHGRGVERDISQAFVWYKKAAALGNIKAQKQIKKLTPEYGATDAGIINEKREATSQAKDNIVTGTPGKMLESKAGQDSASAKDNNLTTEETGDAKTQNTLALSYLNGTNGYNKDEAKAAYWFAQAADKGNIDAQNNLGLLFLHGIGVEKNLQEAARWLQKASEGGNAAAQSNLGLMFYYGEGVEQDYQQSAFWLLKAAKQGHAGAQNNLAVMYSEGLGVEKNQEHSMYWLQKAADQGDATARRNLALLVVNKQEATADSLSQDAYLGPPSGSFSTANKNQGTAGIALPNAKPGFAARQKAKEHFKNGNQLAKEEQFEAAISEYEKAIGLDPSNSNTYENLAIAYAKKGNISDAVKSMHAAIHLSPEDAMKYSTLGVIYHADKKLHKALEQYTRSVRLNPGFGEMYYNIAMTYRELGKPEYAYKAARQAQSLGYTGSSILLLELKKSLPDDIENILAEDNTTLHLRQIITPVADEAEFVLGKLREGGDFSQLAAQFSLQPFNINGGYIGPFTANELMKEIAEVVVPLTPLAFSPVVKTTTGYHIFQKFTVDADLLVSNQYSAP